MLAFVPEISTVLPNSRKYFLRINLGKIKQEGGKVQKYLFIRTTNETRKFKNQSNPGSVTILPAVSSCGSTG